MVMRRYISHLFTWVISFLTLLAFSSCLNEHPKDQLDGGGSNGSASEIFDTTIAPLYDFMGGAIDGEGICDIQRLDNLLSLSPDDEQLYSSWQYLYRAIGMCNKSLDMIDFQSVRLTDNQKAQFKAEVPWLGALIGSAVIGFWYWCTDQFIVQRVLSGKNEKEARRGTIFGAYLKLLPVFLFLIPGMIAFAMSKNGIALNGEVYVLPSADAAFPSLVAKLLPAGVKGLVVCGILAALMSSLASQIGRAHV